MPIPSYPLPGFLAALGVVTQSEYGKWLDNKADTLLKRDQKQRRPFALNVTNGIYKQEIHKAVLASGRFDPYSGGELRWDLIGKWDDNDARKEHASYKKEFAMMPTVDHVDPDVLAFEICSWQINECKSDLNRDEFIGLCARIAKYRKTAENK